MRGRRGEQYLRETVFKPFHGGKHSHQLARTLCGIRFTCAKWILEQSGIHQFSIFLHVKRDKIPAMILSMARSIPRTSPASSSIGTNTPNNCASICNEKKKEKLIVPFQLSPCHPNDKRTVQKHAIIERV
jgi:hypothetical protein